eukprot:3079524-Pyramimonas_sp.AAC.1
MFRTRVRGAEAIATFGKPAAIIICQALADVEDECARRLGESFMFEVAHPQSVKLLPMFKA